MRGERLSADALRQLIRCDERGYDVKQIARALDVSVPTVYRWLRIFEAEGWEGLKYKPRRNPVRPSRRTPTLIVDAILAWVAEEPGLSLVELAERATPLRYPKEPRRKWQHVSPETVRKILRKAGWKQKAYWVQDGARES
jgi:transposase